jgi:hypothetical protein
LRVIVFDQMIPRIAHYWPKETVERLMQQAKLEEICIKPVNDVSWSACGRKPRASLTSPPDIDGMAPYAKSSP